MKSYLNNAHFTFQYQPIVTPVYTSWKAEIRDSFVSAAVLFLFSSCHVIIEWNDEKEEDKMNGNEMEWSGIEARIHFASLFLPSIHLH